MHDAYAPTELATLCAKGYDYWALGHVRARELVCEVPCVVFPINLQERHANETGPKGCELARTEAADRLLALRVSLGGASALFDLEARKRELIATLAVQKPRLSSQVTTRTESEP